MASNVKIQLIRGLLANLPATFNSPGLVVWTTDSNELFVDTGTALQRLAAGNQVFDITDPSQLTGLAAMIGDVAVVLTGSPLVPSGTYMLTAFPATNANNWKLIAGSSGADSGTDVVALPGATAHQWVTYIDSNGVQHLSQPAFTDISGQLAQTQLPTSIGAGSALTSIDCGTF